MHAMELFEVGSEQSVLLALKPVPCQTVVALKAIACHMTCCMYRDIMDMWCLSLYMNSTVIGRCCKPCWWNLSHWPATLSVHALLFSCLLNLKIPSLPLPMNINKPAVQGQVGALQSALLAVACCPAVHGRDGSVDLLPVHDHDLLRRGRNFDCLLPCVEVLLGSVDPLPVHDLLCRGRNLDLFGLIFRPANSTYA